MGARRAVGFDQSGRFLDQARELNAIAGRGCEFLESDVLKIGRDHDGNFDLVLVTIGVFGWIPDLVGLAAVAARLLRPGGTLFVYEQHPVLDMFDAESDRPFEAISSYFRTEPHVIERPIVYDRNRPPDPVTSYWFNHTLGEIFSCLLAQGLAIEHFREYPHNITTTDFDIFLSRGALLPMCYTLLARKPS